MPERFKIYIVYKRRYINTLPFLSFPITDRLSGPVREISRCVSVRTITLPSSTYAVVHKHSTTKGRTSMIQRQRGLGAFTKSPAHYDLDL